MPVTLNIKHFRVKMPEPGHISRAFKRLTDEMSRLEYGQKGEQMLELNDTKERPKNLVEALRQVVLALEGKTQYPLWLSASDGGFPHKGWIDLFNDAANIAEQYEIQNDSYSRLMKQVYG